MLRSPAAELSTKNSDLISPARFQRRTDNSIKNFYNATVRSKAINKNESILVRLA